MNKNGKKKQPYKGITMSFNRTILREIYNNNNIKNYISDNNNIAVSDQKIFKIKTNAEVISLFESLVPYFDRNIKLNDKVVYLKLMEAIFVLIHQSDIFYTILFDFHQPWKIDILNFLNQHYMDELNISEIASYTGRSLATFKRDFKKISDLTPQKWLIKKRLEIAYQKIKEGRKIQDVCFEVGFKNLSHFSNVFRKKYLK